jgi:hypothetical protein
MEFYDFPIILGISSSQLTNSYVSEGFIQSTNQLLRALICFNIHYFMVSGWFWFHHSSRMEKMYEAWCGPVKPPAWFAKAYGVEAGRSDT